MKVKELIKKLNEIDQELELIVSADGGLFDIDNVDVTIFIETKDGKKQEKKMAVLN